MAATQGLFVTGTDTDVGKSLVSCAIIRLLREQGIDAVGFKPVATGEVQGSWGDAQALWEASGKVEPIERICPMRFALPAAPTVAARHERIDLDLNLARNAFVQLSERHPAVIVEGVGGVMVPMDDETLVVDFAAQIGFPVLLVCRAALGTINHTLLTIREIERSKLRIAGIIMSVSHPQDTGMVKTNVEEIERVSGNKVIAVLPWLGQDLAPDAPPKERVARAIASLVKQVDVKKLLGSEGAYRANKTSQRFRRRRATD